jgi:FKBP-type peptidyl-prolyl cis-trans isomerase
MKLIRKMIAALAAVGCLTMLVGCGDEEDSAKEITVFTDQGQVVMRYIDVVEGKGETVKKGDIIRFHYTGWTQGGYKFESSRDKGVEPKMEVGNKGRGLIGWHEGIPGMKVGGMRKLFIPAQLAFKDQGSVDNNGRPDGRVKPNMKVTYEIEVLKITNDLDSR